MYIAQNKYELHYTSVMFSGVVMFTYSINEYKRTQLHDIDLITCSKAEI